MKNIEQIVKKHLNRVIKEQETENYMFFENLKQIHWQTEKLMSLDPQMIDQLLHDGHDWAEDHLATAKESIDQVFHFIMKREHEDETPQENMMESKKKQEVDEAKHEPTNKKLWSSCLSWARSKYKVCPSAYCNGAAVKRYNSKGGKWKTKK